MVMIHRQAKNHGGRSRNLKVRMETNGQTNTLMDRGDFIIFLTDTVGNNNTHTMPSSSGQPGKLVQERQNQSRF